MQYIRWNGKVGTREIRGYTFEPGQILLVEEDEVALDMQTQPGESFEEIGPGHPDYPGNEPAELKDIPGITLRHLKAFKKLGVTELGHLAELDQVGVEALAEATGFSEIEMWVQESRRLTGATASV